MNHDPQAAAKAGAAWCDSVDPEWFRRIDLGELEMHDPDRCVLGQCDRLKARRYAEREGGRFGIYSVDLGFDLPEYVYRDEGDEETEDDGWWRLDQAWRAEIAARAGA